MAVAAPPSKTDQNGGDMEAKKMIANAGPSAEKSAGSKAKPEPQPQVSKF